MGLGSQRSSPRQSVLGLMGGHSPQGQYQGVVAVVSQEQRESREQSPLGKPSHWLKTGPDRGPGAVGGWCSAEDSQGHEAGGL